MERLNEIGKREGGSEKEEVRNSVSLGRGA